ncbi:MAG: RsmB/NOP family class I SAM-dependent RNA methyltransferase [Pseudomonadota bacterium]
MRAAGRILAAIEVLDAVLTRHRPVANALADWGRNNRFAGSGDRAVIGNLVYDAVRARRSIAARMDAETPRALILGTAARSLGLPYAAIDEMCTGERHTPEPLSDAERAGLAASEPEDAPASVRADIPDWLVGSFANVFGADRIVAEGRALAERAPLDMRVNTIKAERDKVLAALEKTGAVPTPYSAVGLRIAPVPGGKRHPNVEAEAAHGKGWFEIQDEGSQIAALLAGAGPRQQVLDFCAGAGGKTLALGAMMQNTGQIFAYDRDKVQLRPLFDRARRAGLRNVQVLEAGNEAALSELGPRFDTAFVDAPCSGSGTWRRRPDAKWRLKPESLEARRAEQHTVIRRGAEMVRPGGRLVYVTCSVLADENDAQVSEFLRDTTDFALVPFADAWSQHVGGEVPVSADGHSDTLLLTPARHGMDGFFVAVMRRAGE